MSIEVKTARVHEFGKVQIETWPLDSQPVGEDEVVVQVCLAPINPSDYYRMTGKFESYNPQLPFVPGGEGLGKIVKVGKNVDKKLEGRSAVVLSLRGVYASHVILPRKTVYVLDEKIPQDVATHSFAVNPLTAIGMLKDVKDIKAKAFIHTAASSNVCKWLTVLAKRDGLKSIAITRNYNHDAELKALGADVILNSSAENFQQLLREAVEKYKPTALLDALGGAQPTKILQAMPEKSVMWNYGLLEGVQVDGVGIFSLSGSKSVKAFFLPGDYLAQEKPETVEKELNKALQNDPVVKEDVEITEVEKINETLEHWNDRKKKILVKF